jgi:hypothetical protein
MPPIQSTLLQHVSSHSGLPAAGVRALLAEAHTELAEWLQHTEHAPQLPEAQQRKLLHRLLSVARYLYQEPLTDDLQALYTQPAPPQPPQWMQVRAQVELLHVQISQAIH